MAAIEEELVNEPVNSVTLLNSWVDYNTATHPTAGYWKDNCGMVHLQGIIKDGTTTEGTVLLVLPEGFRPAKQEVFGVISNNALGRIDISPDGRVCIQAGVSSDWVSLAGVSFRKN